jgi:hypothetical protein
MTSRQTDPPRDQSGRVPDGPPPDGRLPLSGRLLVAALGATAAALGGVGVAYASTADDSHWVTVVEDDPPRNCPEKDQTGGGDL